MLRASSQASGQAYDLSLVNGAGTADGNIPHGRLFVEFAEAVIGTDDARFEAVRVRLRSTLGDAAAVDAAAVVATFNAIDRVADATGTPAEQVRAASTVDMRAFLGLDDYPSARIAGQGPPRAAE